MKYCYSYTKTVTLSGILKYKTQTGILLFYYKKNSISIRVRHLSIRRLICYLTFKIGLVTLPTENIFESTSLLFFRIKNTRSIITMTRTIMTVENSYIQ